MWGCKPTSSVRAVLVAAMCAVAAWGCSSRTLVVVDTCDGGPGCSIRVDALLPGDTSPITDRADASNTSDTADAAPLMPLRQGLVGLWHLDDGTGSPVASDSSGNRNHGTLTGFPTTSVPWVTGQLGGAFETASIGYALVVPSASIDSIVTEVTLAAWIYLDPADGPIVDHAAAASRQIGAGLTQHYHLSLDRLGRPNAYINRGIPNDFLRNPTADDPVVPLTWTHLAVTYDGLNATLYVDGVEKRSLPISGTFAPDTTPLILGGNGNYAEITERFPGRVDEIVLYNRALSPLEIRDLAAGVLF
jgi:hypothetical protein